MNANELKKQIVSRVEEIATLTDETRISEAMKTHLDTIAKFPHYSLLNTMQILFHNPNASYVAGYTTWQKMHRYVKRGEHGIPILAPIRYAAKDDPDGEDIVGFKIVYVFDISQTDGQELPTLQWADDDKDTWLNERLTDYAIAHNITVEFADIEGTTRGYSCGGKIVISNHAGTDTLIHELAHELLNHHDHATATNTAEIEAESIAYIVCNHYNLKLTNAINYITLWSNDGKEIINRLGRITKCATEIITYIDSPTKDD